MTLPSPLTKKQVFRELFPLTTVLHETFPEIASEIVLPYFADRGRVVDPRLATDMFRYEMKHRLTSSGIYAAYDEDPAEQDVLLDVGLEQIPNNGIEGMFEGWPFKLLRSRNGAVPPPGKSKRRRRYYDQQLPLYQQLRLQGFGDYRPSPFRPNAVILWDFDDSYRKVQINIAIPQATLGEFGPVSCQLNDVVPHPVEVASQQPVVAKSLVGNDNLKELPITRKETGEVGSEEHSFQSNLPDLAL